MPATTRPALELTDLAAPFAPLVAQGRYTCPSGLPPTQLDVVRGPAATVPQRRASHRQEPRCRQRQ
jgi:hypothetical protein